MRILTTLFVLFIIAIIILADTGNLGILRTLTAHDLDKVGHFVLYGILTLLLDLTFLQSDRFKPRPGLLVFRMALILSLLIGLEEYSQRFFPARTVDLVDLACSYLGVIFFSWVALKATGREILPPRS